MRFPARGVNVSRLDHLNLFASDVTALRVFFEDVLGLRVTEKIVLDSGAEAGVWVTSNNKTYDVFRGFETSGDDFWAFEGFDIKAALARVFTSDEVLFPEKRIELPASFDAREQYDFFLVLAPHETSEMRNRLMQEGIERHFRVSIAHRACTPRCRHTR
jgi:catechol 2,3-dioxygenase-like lactoylglutathione lyase family enzyme